MNMIIDNNVDDTPDTLAHLRSVLDGSFDAGALVYGNASSNGEIIHLNDAALDLFECRSADDVVKTIGQLVSFWSPTTIEPPPSPAGSAVGSGTTKSSTRSSREVDINKKKESDQLSWNQVVEAASKSVDPIRKWKITGTKVANSTSSGDGNGNASKESDENSTKKVTTTSKATSFRTTFPGVLQMTAFPASAISSTDSGDGSKIWLAYIRHADHHDIIKCGTGSYHGDVSSARPRILRGSKRQIDLPTITIDESGTIVDIHNPGKEETFDWIQTGLIGSHMSEAKTKQKLQGEPSPFETMSSSSKPKQGKSKKTAMLDLILSNHMDAGHPSCPYSGLTLQAQDYNTALTTGNAIREENITEAAFEAALDPIFQIDEHGTIQMVNSAASKTFGWTRDEFIGSNISMIVGGGHAAYHSSYMERYLATGDTRVIGKNRQLPAKKKDGSEFPIELGVVEVDTFAGDVRLFCGFVRDLSDIKAREKLAQEIVEVALDPMFQINQEGQILMVNKAAELTFGYTREELLGENVAIICGGSHPRNHQYYIKQYLRTGINNVIGKYRELPARRKDGSEFPIQLAVVEIQIGNKNDRLFCGFIHDLSSLKREKDIMRGTIDTSLDPVLHVNTNGIIQMVNNATTEHLGYTREDLVGQNVSLIVGGHHAAKHGEYIERYLKTGEKRAMGKKRQLTARRKDGSELKIILGLSEIEILGGKERMFVAFLNLREAMGRSPSWSTLE